MKKDLAKQAAEKLINAILKKNKETIAANANVALLRNKKESIRESAQFVETVITKEGVPAGEGPRVRVVLISEGLGNRANMNYYGPEAIQSAPGIFEGKSCFLNHPSEWEEQDIPERRVENKCGYFKNVRVEVMDGLSCVTGELHFDLSETGQMGYQKALTSLHYKQEFPGSTDEYVGLSINADGDVEKRAVAWMGEQLDVKYVTRFTDASSCDIVTTPARGGKFLALVESAVGALNKEDTAMKKGLTESLKALRSLLNEASKEKDAKVLAEKVAEAKKTFEAFLKEAADADVEAIDDKAKEADTKKVDGADADVEADPVKPGFAADMICPHCGEAISNPEAKKEDAMATPVTPTGESVDGQEPKLPVKACEDEDATESRRIAIKSLLTESGLDKRLTVEEFEGKTLKEARIEIEKIAKIVDAERKDVFSKTGFVPAGFRNKVSESKSGVDADAEIGAILKK